MIPKKLLCSFVLMSFLLSLNLFGSGGLYFPPNFAKNIPTNASVTDIARFVMDKFVQMVVAVKLDDGKTSRGPIQEQWEKFVANNVDQINVEDQFNSLKSLYQKFVEKVGHYGSNENRFDDFLKNQGIVDQVIQDLTLPDFLTINSVQNVFLIFGQDVFAQMQQLSSLPEQSITQDQIDAAKAVLNITIFGIPTENEISKAYRKMMQNYQRAGTNDQNLLVAYNNAKDLLMQALESSSSSSSDVIVLNHFPEFVSNNGEKIAQDLLQQGGSMEQMMTRLQNEKIAPDMSNDDMAYMMGYVQFCIEQLQKSSNFSGINTIDALERTANVLKELQQARRA